MQPNNACELADEFILLSNQTAETDAEYDQINNGKWKAFDLLVDAPAVDRTAIAAKLRVAMTLRQAEHDVMIDRILESAIRDLGGLH